MIKVFIIDDEPLARTRIKNLLKEYQKLQIVGESGEVHESIEKINANKPDLLFLDIQLKVKKGFKILEHIDYLPQVVFVTAYSEYAIQAFDYYAIDYLLKPFNDERFHRAVSRALELDQDKSNDWDRRVLQLLAQGNQANERLSLLVRIPVRVGDKTHFVNTDQIQYIKASAYYAELFAVDGKHVIRESLSALAKTLNPDLFLRVHRSTIVNINYIKELISIGFGDIEIKTTDGAQLRVSKSYKEELMKKMGIR